MKARKEWASLFSFSSDTVALLLCCVVFPIPDVAGAFPLDGVHGNGAIHSTMARMIPLC